MLAIKQVTQIEERSQKEHVHFLFLFPFPFLFPRITNTVSNQAPGKKRIEKHLNHLAFLVIYLFCWLLYKREQKWNLSPSPPIKQTQTNQRTTLQAKPRAQ